jgi:hypothetical protein
MSLGAHGGGTKVQCCGHMFSKKLLQKSYCVFLSFHVDHVTDHRALLYFESTLPVFPMLANACRFPDLRLDCHHRGCYSSTTGSCRGPIRKEGQD